MNRYRALLITAILFLIVKGSNCIMPLKYQSEIDNFKLDINCPDNVFSPNEDIEAFRFSFSPIDHQWNFLPNVIFDRVANIPYDYQTATAKVKCVRCGMSFFTSLEAIRRKWNFISRQNKSNFKYTHIAHGRINGDDGLMGKPNKEGHYSFYESDVADLTKKFTLIAEL